MEVCNPEKVEDIVRERVATDFMWASRKFNPSEYFIRGAPKNRTELINLVRQSDRVWYAIQQISKKNSNAKDGDDQQAEVGKILLELTHDFRMYTVRWFGVTLARLSRTLYSGIQVHVRMLPEIREAYKKYPVILLPTHRSYADFLLISFVSFNYDLALPMIAAGMDFMGMAGVGEMMRKSGAFYIRRTFGGDLLYWATVSEYVRKALLMGGHPLEMFIEGTRSRSGKSLSPKIGLLSAALELVRSSDIPDISILPIALSYDRTLEDTLYARELLGIPKPKESTKGLFQALSWLGSQKYGSVYVNFGRPISFRRILEAQGVSGGDFTKAVKQAAEGAILSHQQHLRVPLFAGISLIFLSWISRGAWSLPFASLVKALKHLRLLLRSGGSDFGYPLQGDTIEANVEYLIKVHVAIVKKEEEVVTVTKIHCQDETILLMKLQHYANQILPQSLPFCIVSLLKMAGNEGEILEEHYAFVRRLFRADFLYPAQGEGPELKRTLQNLEKFECGADISKVLRLGLEPYLLAYWATMKVLAAAQSGEEKKSFDIKNLGKISQQLLIQEMKSNLPPNYGALSLETMGNACLSLIAFGAADKVKTSSGALEISVGDKELLIRLLQHVEELISSNIEKSNWKSTSNLSLLCSKL